MLNITNHQIEKYELCIKTYLEKTSNDPHDNPTKFQLCDDIVSKIHNTTLFSNTTKVLILCNIEFVKVLSLKYKDLGLTTDNIHFVTICPAKQKMVGALIHYKNIYKYDNYNQFFEDNTLPKFDVVIGNPPYSKNLHLKFLEKAYEISKTHVYLIHPSNWLTVQKPGKNKNDGDKIKTLVGNSFESFTVFNGNYVFGIRLFGPCVITKIDKTKTDNIIKIYQGDDVTTYESANDINPFFADPIIFNSLKSKIWGYCASVDNIQNNLNKKNKFYVSMENIIGDANDTLLNTCVMDCHYDFNYLTNRNITSEIINTKNGFKPYLGFDNENDARNCLNYLTKSKFSKFTLMISKIGQHLNGGRPLLYTPHFDFTEEWTDAKIYKELKLTQEEINFLEHEIDKFYSNYPDSMFKV